MSVVVIDALQRWQNKKFVAENYAYPSAGGDVLVVYFSRSGNTEIMAQEIAKAARADVVELVSDAYRIGFVGWVNALRDARRNEATISPASMDLSPYQTIYVGSPIWLYSPAPPIWEFISRNDFSGKRVVLFNSMNSKFDQKYIDDFAELVRRKGGSFDGHIYVIRGRMTQQMSTDELLDETRRQINALRIAR
ncbi:flavodoxin [Rhizobium sp. BK060]|uniref:flavodoxin n=1 Tax=Rhizobium sp. BK060 TaxID=2587096 RepID=UPI00161863C5|nr:flavodoxin [Rhizobium sp. BK060]